jgi:hypothetical protein
MPKLPAEEWELGKRLLAERGESDPEKALEGLIAKAFAEGKVHSTDSAALRYVLNDLRMVSKPIENVEGIVLAYSPARGGQEERYMLGTPSGIRRISGLPDNVALYRRVSIGKGTEKKNEETGTVWVEADKETVTMGDAAPYQDVSRLLAPLSTVKGANQMVFTTFTVQFVNALPKERFNPNAPPIQPGQKVDTRPLYDPGDRTFGMALQVVDGSAVQGKIRLTDEQVLHQLTLPDELSDRFWNWFHSAETPDATRIKELTLMLQGRQLIGVFQASDEIRGQRIKASKTGATRYSLSLFNGGWLMLRDRFDAQFQSGGPVVPTAPAKDSTPAAAAPSAPAASDARSTLLARLHATPNGEMTLAEIQEFKKDYGASKALSDEEVEKEVTKALVGLRTENVVILTGGKVKLKK